MPFARLLASVCVSFVALVATLGVGATAHASFHLVKIVGVFPGTHLQPDAQYVLLQAYSASQTNLAGHKVIYFDAAGTKIGEAAFTGAVTNGANQMMLLVGTDEAATLFGVTPDLKTTVHFDPAGGKICWDTLDCVSWGQYTGAEVPFSPTLGLRSGEQASRRLDIAGGASTLEAGDDTGDNANDFVATAPTPKNNAGQSGTVPAATCGNGTVEGLEDCDDHNGTAGDGCTECVADVCGDGVTNDTHETCDDGNLEDGDGCDKSCQSEGTSVEVVADTGPDMEAEVTTTEDDATGDTTGGDSGPTDTATADTATADTTTADTTTADTTTADTTTADTGAADTSTADTAVAADTSVADAATADTATAASKSSGGCAGAGAEGAGVVALLACVVLARRRRD